MVRVEFDVTRFGGVEGMVGTLRDVLACVEGRAALPNNDLAGEDVLV
jgi:hypothetical protein